MLRDWPSRNREWLTRSRSLRPALFRQPNNARGAADIEYAVDSDLPGVSGSPTVTVPAKGDFDYRLSICPQFGGVFTGSLTFTSPGGLLTWYTIEVRSVLRLGCSL